MPLIMELLENTSARLRGNESEMGPGWDKRYTGSLPETFCREVSGGCRSGACWLLANFPIRLVLPLV